MCSISVYFSLTYARFPAASWVRSLILPEERRRSFGGMSAGSFSRIVAGTEPKSDRTENENSVSVISAFHFATDAAPQILKKANLPNRKRITWRLGFSRRCKVSVTLQTELSVSAVDLQQVCYVNGRKDSRIDLIVIFMLFAFSVFFFLSR